jgi:hypothetical protein
VEAEEIDRELLSLGEGEVEGDLPRNIDRCEVEDMEEESLGISALPWEGLRC